MRLVSRPRNVCKICRGVCIYLFLVYFLLEWKRAIKKEVSSLLYEGRYIAAEVTRQVDVCYKLHGDGEGDRGAPKLPA